MTRRSIVAFAGLVIAGSRCDSCGGPYDDVYPFDGGFAGGIADSGSAGGGSGGGVEYTDAGVGDCAAALNAGQAGEPCNQPPSYWCDTQDFACGGNTRCDNHQLVVSRGCSDAGKVYSCAPFPSGTLLSGTTPLGAIDFRAAWGSPSWGLRRDLILQFANGATAAQLVEGSLGLVTNIDAHTAPEDDVAMLSLDGGHLFVPVSIVLERTDMTRVSGTISITAPGWNVSGTFNAPLCPELDRSGS